MARRTRAAPYLYEPRARNIWHLKTSREFEIIILLNGLCVHGSANMHASDAT